MAAMSSLEAVRRKIRSLQEQADAAEERAGRLQREVDQERALREEVGPRAAQGRGQPLPARRYLRAAATARRGGRSSAQLSPRARAAGQRCAQLWAGVGSTDWCGCGCGCPMQHKADSAVVCLAAGLGEWWRL